MLDGTKTLIGMLLFVRGISREPVIASVTVTCIGYSSDNLLQLQLLNPSI